MRTNLFQYYKLRLKKISSEHTIITSILNTATKEKKFSYPVTNHKSKLYIVKYKNKIVYVGITAQPIINRLRSGLKPHSKYGYHGYAWRHLNNVDLMVWCDWGHDKAKKEDIKNSEIIEAEIVYFIRQNTGKWPKYQTEIHFNNATEQQKIIARAICIITKMKK